MLLSIRLHDFVIVERAEIEFEPGFCALSGETGAGKSILIDALGLALGARADPGVVRSGSARADIVALFSAAAPVVAWLSERELVGDPGEVQLRRVIDVDGRSKAFVNGITVTAAVLRELGGQLLEIHGQHASQSLMRADGQRDLLDAFAGAQTARERVARAYQAWRDAGNAILAAERDARELDVERERLAWVAAELSALRPQPGEWASLESDQTRLANAASLIEGTRAAAMALSEDDDACGARLRQIAGRIRALAAYDARLVSAAEMVESAAINAEEAGSELADYAERVDLDAERLAQVERRIAALHASARKLRLDPGSLADEHRRVLERLEALERGRDLDVLRRHEQSTRADYDACAGELRASRIRAAAAIADEVTRGIGELGMAGARFVVDVDEAERGPHGTERIEFRVAGHAGVDPRPLARVASGGELSRVALAIAVAAARANPVPTLIFDEADAGVGGAVADAIGSLMRRLGATHQVLCVTHLPQVAARAHHQWRVSKATVAGRAVSRIERLDAGARIDEIARMLGGASVTATTRQHAEELLAGAQASTDAYDASAAGGAVGTTARAGDAAKPAPRAPPKARRPRRGTTPS